MSSLETVAVLSAAADLVAAAAKLSDQVALLMRSVCKSDDISSEVSSGQHVEESAVVDSGRVGLFPAADLDDTPDDISFDNDVVLIDGILDAPASEAVERTGFVTAGQLEEIYHLAERSSLSRCMVDDQITSQHRLKSVRDLSEVAAAKIIRALKSRIG